MDDRLRVTTDTFKPSSCAPLRQHLSFSLPVVSIVVLAPQHPCTSGGGFDVSAPRALVALCTWKRLCLTDWCLCLQRCSSTVVTMSVDMAALRAYITAKDGHEYDGLAEDTVMLTVTHSNLKQTWPDLRLVRDRLRSVANEALLTLLCVAVCVACVYMCTNCERAA